MLLLDEPASGLDPRARIEMMAILQELQRLGKTIIISSHILSELQTLCNRVAIIEKGKLIYSGPVQGVRDQMSQGRVVWVRVSSDPAQAMELLKARPEVVRGRDRGWRDEGHTGRARTPTIASWPRCWCKGGAKTDRIARGRNRAGRSLHAGDSRGDAVEEIDFPSHHRARAAGASSNRRRVLGAMTLLPVISREMRSAARQPLTYYLRAIAVGALLLVSLLFGFQHGFGSSLGRRLFGALHLTLFAVIWVLVPVISADCLGRERREGTLGLLFLTGLRASSIVLAKGLAHGLRAFCLWLAVLPVLTIPFLLGGVTGSEAVVSAAINFSAICWATAAGLLASSGTKVRVRALLAALLLSLLFLLAMGFVVGGLMTLLTTPRGFNGYTLESIVDFVLLTGLGFIANVAQEWPAYFRLAQNRMLLLLMAEAGLVSILALAAAILVAGARTRRVWQEQPPSARQLWWQRTFCTPVLGKRLLRRWLSWRLERNPIGWLEQRTWTGRLVTWGWFAVVVSLYSAVFSDPQFIRGYSGLQRTLAWLLVGSMAMTSAGSFRRERETGVLELLLVSPLREGNIIWGRLRGLWGQFLPAVLLLLGIWVYFSSFLPDSGVPGVFCFYASSFLTIPIVGLYFSLHYRNFIAAFLATLVLDLALPLILPGIVDWLIWCYTGRAGVYYSGSHDLVGWTISSQLAFAGFWLWQLYSRLRGRSFVLERLDK